MLTIALMMQFTGLMATETDVPSFNTLWQATKCAGYPRKVTQLQLAKKTQVEAGYKDSEDYLRNKWLGGRSEPQIKPSAFPYKIKVLEGEAVEQLVLWLPHPDWSFVERVYLNDTDAKQVRIKEEFIPRFRDMVETIIGDRFEDKDILMYVFHKTKERLPNLPHVQVCIRRKSHARMHDLSGDIFSQEGYDRVIQTALAHSPLEHQIVPNETHRANGVDLRNPFIPADALEKATRKRPRYNKNVATFLARHESSIRDFENLVYGKDFVYALHGTKVSITKEDGKTIPLWQLIQDNGLLPSGDASACGAGIYCAKSMGLCSNSSRGEKQYPHGKPEFTTIQYGSNMEKPDITCAIVVLVMNPRKCDKPVEKESKTQCYDWILPQAGDALIIDMLEMNPKNLAEIMLKYDNSELAKTTEVKKVICPDGAQKSHQSLLHSIKSGLSSLLKMNGSSKPKRRKRKPRVRSAKSQSIFMLRDLEDAERYEPLADGVTDFDKKFNMFEMRAREEKRQQNRRRTVAKILSLYQADKKYAGLTRRKLKRKIQQDHRVQWLRTDLSVWA